jgi:hypothetical protein
MIHDLAHDFAHAQAIQVALPCTPRRRQAEGCFFAASGRLGRGRPRLGSQHCGVCGTGSRRGWRPEASKLDPSSTSSGYAGREISSPPPAFPAPVSRSRPPLDIGPAVGHGIAARWGRASRVPLLPCLSACLPVASLLLCFSASLLPSSTLPCCHVPFTPPPVVLPPVCHFPHPLLNPGCFLSPSVFRTRTHERPRPRPRGPLLSFRAGCFVSASHCYRRYPLHRSRAAEGSRIQMKNMSRDPPRPPSLFSVLR